MAALTITATAIVPVSGAANDFRTHEALAAMTAGQLAYWDPALDRVGLFDADSAAPHNSTPYGVVVGPGVAAGQRVTVQRRGQLAFGAILTKGLVYVGGAVAGAIHPSADLAAGWRIQLVGVAVSTSVMELLMRDLGVVV